MGTKTEKDYDMTTKHKPATPLPWRVVTEDPDVRHSISSEVWGADDELVAPTYEDNEPYPDAAYIAHTANAYPKLVASVRNLLYWTKPDTTISDEARLLLNELGEDFP